MRRLLISASFAAMVLSLGGCEEAVQIAAANGPAYQLKDSLTGEVRVVYVNGEPDYCIVVESGTDRPMPMDALVSAD